MPRKADRLAQECKRQGFKVRRTKAGYQVRDGTGNIVNFHGSLSDYDKQTLPALQKLGLQLDKRGGAMPQKGATYEASHICNECDKPFKYKGSLDRHVTAEHGPLLEVRSQIAELSARRKAREQEPTSLGRLEGGYSGPPGDSEEEQERSPHTPQTNGDHATEVSEGDHAFRSPSHTESFVQLRLSEWEEMRAKQVETEAKLTELQQILSRAVDIL